MAKSEASRPQYNRRVVITGLGVLSSIGIGKERFWESLKSGRSGIKRITTFDTTSYDCQIAGEISDFVPDDFMPSQIARRIDRFAQFGIAAARLAVADAKLSLADECPQRVGVILGTSIGTLCYAEQQIALFYEKGVKRINPFFATSVIPSSAVTQITLDLGIHGPSRTITTACASGTGSIGEAFRLIKTGDLDVILAGASEAPITPLVLSTLSSIQLLSVANDNPGSSYRAFSGDAAGFVLGEGASILVLEELEHALRRDASIYAEVVGFGASLDAYHVMTFAPGLDQPVEAIRQCLQESQVLPIELGYINPHGIAIPDNDRGEIEILRKAFGEAISRIPLSATKPLTGHVLGGSGALEIAGCCLMMANNYLHPTINFSDSPSSVGLDFIANLGRAQKVDTMLSVSFGFGGYNAACVIRRFAD